MIARTAARRTAIAGFTALGALVLAAPASALDVGGTVELAPGVTQQADGTFRNEAGQLVDAAGNLLPVPVPPVPPPPAPVQEVVEQVKEAVIPAQPAPKPDSAPPPPQNQAAPPQDSQAAGQNAAAPPPAAPPGEAAPAGTVTATSIGGMGFASAPGSIAALDRAAFSAGTGTAANPMSLFGAPQVALPPTLDTPSVAAPQVFTPANAALPDLIPVGTPDSVPGYLTALACAVVAGAAGAHVAALRSRRAGAPATA